MSVPAQHCSPPAPRKGQEALGGAGTGERRKKRAQPEAGRTLQKTAFPSEAGGKPGTQGGQSGPKCGNLPQPEGAAGRQAGGGLGGAGALRPALRRTESEPGVWRLRGRGARGW